MKPVHIPPRLKHIFNPIQNKPIPRIVPARSDYKHSVYTEVEILRLNNNIKSILQSNYPTILFKTKTEAVLNKTGERLSCQVDWKATPYYKGTEDHLESKLYSDCANLQEYISRRLKLKRKIKLEYYQNFD
eukprot:NODE_13_length_54415_cov_0.522424.p43 type:complete len:131 gc:universal NODE_13_length_54415_cov_0.522424:20700-20308(-)